MIYMYGSIESICTTLSETNDIIRILVHAACASLYNLAFTPVLTALKRSTFSRSASSAIPLAIPLAIPIFVIIGLTPLADGNTEASAMYKFCVPQTLPL